MARKIIQSIDSSGKSHLSNILSRYTGKPLTYTQTDEITTDAECKMPIYKKYKGIYHAIDGFHIYDPREFGVVGNAVDNDSPAFQACIDSASLRKKAINIDGLSMRFLKPWVIDAPITITGGMWTTTLWFDQVPAEELDAFVLGNLKGVNGFKLSGARIVGSNAIRWLNMNRTADSRKAVTNCTFEDLRVENFKIAHKAVYAWCNNFKNVRLQNCDKPLELGSQCNRTTYYECSFIGQAFTSTLTNCEAICMIGPNIGNSLATSAFSLYQSNLTFIDPYYEYLAGNAVSVGNSNEENSSSFTSLGGKSTDAEVRIQLSGHRGTISAKNLSPNSKFVITDGTANLAPSKYTNRIDVDNNQQTATGYLTKWDGMEEAPFGNVFGGGVNTRSVKAIDYSVITNNSIGNNGFNLANNLVVGQPYVLAYAIRKQVESDLITVRHGDLASSLLIVNNPGEEFEMRYVPFVAKRTSIGISWDPGVSLEFWFVGIALNGAVPPPVKSSVMRFNAIPTTGTFKRGDLIMNSIPSSGAYSGWECAASGSPGTWRPIGTVGEIAGVDGGKPALPVTGYRYGNLTTSQNQWYNGTSWVDSFKPLYTLKTGNTYISPGCLTEFFECNTTVALAQTILVDTTTVRGTVKTFRNNGNFSLTIIPDAGVTFVGLANSIVLANKGDYISLIATAPSTWRIENMQVKSVAAALTSPAPTAVTKTTPSPVAPTYTQAEVQKMADDIGNLTSQLNALRTFVLEVVSNQKSAGLMS